MGIRQGQARQKRGLSGAEGHVDVRFGARVYSNEVILNMDT